MLTAILSWRRGLTRHLAKRIGETLGKEDWRGEGGEEGEEGEAVLIKSSNPHLAGGDKTRRTSVRSSFKVVGCRTPNGIETTRDFGLAYFLQSQFFGANLNLLIDV